MSNETKMPKGKIPVFITGSEGMVGRGIKKCILEHFNYRFEIVDPSYGYTKFKNRYHNTTTSEIDITDRDNIEWLKHDLSIYNNLIIIHVAAYAGTDKCNDLPFDSTKSNALGTLNIIELTQALNARLIYFSTTAVNDPDEYMKETGPEGIKGYFDESHEPDPKTLYGLTKYVGEKAVELCLQPYRRIIIKPVFIYGNAPYDNASILRKIFETTYLRTRNQKAEGVEKLNVFLDEKYYKDYMRIETFACLFCNLLYESSLDILIDLGYGEPLVRDVWGHQYVICQEQPKKFGEILDTMNDIIDPLNETGLNVRDHIQLIPSGDYLLNHISTNENLLSKLPDIFDNEEFKDDLEISLEDGLWMLWNSILEMYEK